MEDGASDGEQAIVIVRDLFATRWSAWGAATPPRKAVPAALSVVLDMLRALAAGLVVVQHVRVLVLATWETLAPSEHSRLAACVYFFTSLGHPSVIVFFVMSGYLVGGGFLIDLENDSVSMIRYFANRVSRIYAVLVPALLVGYAMDFVSMNLLHSNLANDALPIHPPSVTALLGNIASLQTIAVPALGTNIALWSLANEFWYYALWPLLVLSIGARRSLRTKLICLVLASAISILIYPTILAYFPLWCLGVLARVAPRPLVRNLAVAAALATLAFVTNRFGRQILNGWLSDFLASLAVSNLLSALQVRPALAPPRHAALFAKFANFSYSLYAVHLPVVVLAATVFTAVSGVQLHARPSLLTLLVAVGLVTTAFLFAWTFSLMTERRTTSFRNALERLARSGRLLSSKGASESPRFDA